CPQQHLVAFFWTESPHRSNYKTAFLEAKFLSHLRTATRAPKSLDVYAVLNYRQHTCRKTSLHQLIPDAPRHRDYRIESLEHPSIELCIESHFCIRVDPVMTSGYEKAAICEIR